VETPFMSLIAAGVVLAVIMLVVGIFWVDSWFVTVFVLPIAIAALTALEVWTHRYIKRYGKFVLISTGQRNQSRESHDSVN